MAGGLPQNLDLGHIQAILASLPKDNAQLNASQEQAQPIPQIDGSYQHATYTHPMQQPVSTDPRLAGRSAPQRVPNSKPQDRAATPLIDPSTITEWKQGLRCVNKIATQNPEFVPAVRKLIRDQEQNVKAWEAGRNRLIEEQDFKRENERTHRAALSLPGLLEDTPILRTPECEKAELDQYDAKVYRATKAMVDSQTSSLKVLGVPFFGVKPYLIVQSAEDLPEDTGSAAVNSSKRITKDQLLDMQRKMLNHLNELYGD